MLMFLCARVLAMNSCRLHGYRKVAAVHTAQTDLSMKHDVVYKQFAFQYGPSA